MYAPSRVSFDRPRDGHVGVWARARSPQALFLVYPSTSTIVFEFFMKETFDGPGEDGLQVMRADRSIEINSTLYKAFMPFALIMLLLYPFGCGRCRGLEPWVDRRQMQMHSPILQQFHGNDPPLCLPRLPACAPRPA